MQNDFVISESCKKYPIILQALARVIHLLGKQALALRGHWEDISNISSNSENPGNILILLQQIALYNPILAEHLNTTLRKNATYLSLFWKNELIEVIRIYTIQSELLGQIKRTKFFSNMVDEVTTHNEEMLSICFRYLDQHEEIRELFLEFLEYERITGSEIRNTISIVFEKKRIYIKKLKGSLL